MTLRTAPADKPAPEFADMLKILASHKYTATEIEVMRHAAECGIGTAPLKVREIGGGMFIVEEWSPVEPAVPAENYSELKSAAGWM